MQRTIVSTAEMRAIAAGVVSAVIADKRYGKTIIGKNRLKKVLNILDGTQLGKSKNNTRWNKICVDTLNDFEKYIESQGRLI